jgi:hypothetical protein
MRVEKKKIEFPDRKISETFLDYSSPLLDALGEHPTKYQVEQVLKIAFTVWNAIVLDSVKGGTEYISLVRDTVKKDLMSSALIERTLTLSLPENSLAYGSIDLEIIE